MVKNNRKINILVGKPQARGHRDKLIRIRI